MLASLLIVFREMVEAGLIVGIVMAATEGIARRHLFIAGGIAAGLLFSAILAAAAGLITSAFSGFGQEVFTTTILLLAVLMLFWHTVWMASHGRDMARQMKALGSAVAAGQKSLLAMGIVVAVAVMREGSEVVLFLYGVAASSKTSPAGMLVGGLLGVMGGGAVSYVLYRGLVAIPLHRLFSVTGWMIALLAAGMAGQAAATLASANFIPTWGDQIWDTSGLLSDGSLVGRALKALVGYSDRPMGVQLAAWVATLIVFAIGMRWARRLKGRPMPKRAAPHATLAPTIGTRR